MILRHTIFAAFLFISILSSKVLSNPYSNYSGSVFIPYANAQSNTGLSDSPTINLGFNGSGHYVPFIMDTGSVGIVASSDIFTPARGAKYLGPGQQFYSSSGIIEVGSWWSATQQIYDAHGNLVATANVPVLQVTSIQCAENARSCEPNNNPRNISVMGIGFARESPQQPRGTPAYNAFLNLQSVLLNGVLTGLPTTWCKGYVVCPNGFYLGLTAENTANAAFVKLLPWTTYSTPQLSEWMPAPMTLSVNGVSGEGHVLMDTGVDTAFLTPPEGANLDTLVECPGSTLVECLDNQNVVGVYLPNETNPVAFYSFRVDQSGNPMQPDGVHVVSGSSVFFNTSRHVLGGINFLYDNTHGYIGYIWNGNSSDNIGYVHPATSTSTTELTSSQNPANSGQNVIFTATVTGSSETPTGGVTFLIDNVQTYVPMTGAVATYSIMQLPRGSHTIIANYSGDATYIRSSSSPLTQIIK